MKAWLVALGIVALAVAASASVATAYVAVVGTAVPVTTAVMQDGQRLDGLLQSAIRDVLDRAIAFTPTIVTLQKVTVIGDRLYILLFIADEDGQATIDALSTDPEPEPTPDGVIPHRGDAGSPPRRIPSHTGPDLGPPF
jgi:hypothetical protein